MLSEEIENAANAATEDLVPSKSRKVYETVFEDFEKWSKEKGATDNFSEKVLLAYFFEKSTNNKASTLWAKYSMLRTMLKLKKNIDISKYSKLLAFIKRKNENYKPKKSKILTMEQVDEFLMKAPDEKYLMMKVRITKKINDN